ncbi:MAG: protein translocase subunit SecF [Clostridia bacterium]|nr:protein translocase subunit SecF [Clostridia bacterium]
MNNFNFVKSRKAFFTIVAVVLVIGIASFIIRGFNVDIDFVGGTTIQLDMNKELTTDDLDGIKATISAMEVGDTPDKLYYSETVTKDVTDEAVEDAADTTADTEADTTADTAEDAAVDAEASEAEAVTDESEAVEVTEELPSILVKPQVSTVQRAGDGTQVIIKLLELDTVTRDAVCNLLAAEYGLDLTNDLMGVNNVGASVSADLRNAAVIATLIAIALMLVYISIRFEILSGLAAVICLAHDIFVMFAVYSLLQIPLNSTMIAAVLTILGYSINATIIVFDRIRENVKLHSKDKFEDNVDASIKQTLTRSLNTTLTTLFTIGLVYILGVDSIKQFALPIIVGIVAGLFSSVCLAGNIWAILKKAFNKNRV